MLIDGFDWDDGNRAKIAKHGVSMDEVETMFRGDPGIAPDLAHSGAEARFLAIGPIDHGRHIFVAFTLRATSGRLRIRPISARYMHVKEVRSYVEGAPPADQ